MNFQEQKIENAIYDLNIYLYKANERMSNRYQKKLCQLLNYYWDIVVK
jgi:hypothetical protein